MLVSKGKPTRLDPVAIDAAGWTWKEAYQQFQREEAARVKLTYEDLFELNWVAKFKHQGQDRSYSAYGRSNKKGKRPWTELIRPYRFERSIESWQAQEKKRTGEDWGDVPDDVRAECEEKLAEGPMDL